MGRGKFMVEVFQNIIIICGLLWYLFYFGKFVISILVWERIDFFNKYLNVQDKKDFKV